MAGPLVAAAVLLQKPVPGLADSKKLSALIRERLALRIKAQAVTYGIGWVAAAEIDRIGLTEATRRAMQAALKQLQIPDTVAVRLIIDGNYNYLCSCTVKPCTEQIDTIIKADATVPAVSAASILAKTARDDFMRQAAKEFPGYGFERHVGYVTRTHLETVKRLGVCRLHRLSYRPLWELAHAK